MLLQNLIEDAIYIPEKKTIGATRMLIGKNNIICCKRNSLMSSYAHWSSLASRRGWTLISLKTMSLKHIMAHLFVKHVLLCHKMGSYIFGVAILQCPTWTCCILNQVSNTSNSKTVSANSLSYYTLLTVLFELIKDLLFHKRRILETTC